MLSTSLLFLTLASALLTMFLPMLPMYRGWTSDWRPTIATGCLTILFKFFGY